MPPPILPRLPSRKMFVNYFKPVESLWELSAIFKVWGTVEKEWFGDLKQFHNNIPQKLQPTTFVVNFAIWNLESKWVPCSSIPDSNLLGEDSLLKLWWMGQMGFIGSCPLQERSPPFPSLGCALFSVACLGAELGFLLSRPLFLPSLH